MVVSYYRSQVRLGSLHRFSFALAVSSRFLHSRQRPREGRRGSGSGLLPPQPLSSRTVGKRSCGAERKVAGGLPSRREPYPIGPHGEGGHAVAHRERTPAALAAEEFDLAEVSFPRVDQPGCARAGTNFYSGPLKAGSVVEARVYSRMVEFRQAGVWVAQHERSYARAQQILDLELYGRWGSNHNSRLRSFRPKYEAADCVSQNLISVLVCIRVLDKRVSGNARYCPSPVHHLLPD